jgi:NAD(P)-dependent dehydrogenase (short-subunit alcohol dehydrogenase family)
MDDVNVAVVVGVGPGLGRAVVRRFARGGFAVAMIARTEAKLEALRDEVSRGGGRALPIAADAADAGSLSAAFDRIRGELGAPSVLVYNAGAFQMGGVLELAAEDFERCWRVGAYGAFVAVQATAPAMIERGAGTMIFTGATASLRGSARFAALASPKFAVRGLAQSVARELGPKGVHVAHVIIDGQIDLPRARAMFPDRAEETFLAPDAIAETYWQLHAQDRTAWTHELDLRPALERW